MIKPITRYVCTAMLAYYATITCIDTSSWINQQSSVPIRHNYILLYHITTFYALYTRQLTRQHSIVFLLLYINTNPHVSLKFRNFKNILPVPHISRTVVTLWPNLAGLNVLHD